MAGELKDPESIVRGKRNNIQNRTHNKRKRNKNEIQTVKWKLRIENETLQNKNIRQLENQSEAIMIAIGLSIG